MSKSGIPGQERLSVLIETFPPTSTSSGWVAAVTFLQLGRVVPELQLHVGDDLHFPSEHQLLEFLTQNCSFLETSAT